ncbi:hypothetical protein D9O36_09380 [Zobellia amurskyensis]|uniref:DUF1579 domain-containing protein n=2 Tax=Zobellia amurskyensis TaxID=248905 RepID=A0A7X2ZTD8_9FLAO|nr:hypothetical protein [Zobellia amurskyensis]
MLLVFLCAFGASAQETNVDQAAGLKRYIGEWVSTVSPESNEVGAQPDIKMVNVPKMEGTALQVEVFQFRNNAYVSILVELINHDVTTNKIVALGQNEKGESFSGTGSFSDKDHWLMTDHDFNGKHTQTVSFQFFSDNEVYLEGKDNTGKILWKTRYVKK